MAKNIEKHTQSQSQSKLWFQQCAGRVTASKLKAAVCTDMSQPSMSLIRSVYPQYPEANCFRRKTTSWGCEHEKTAIEAYASQAKAKHKELKISNSGLVVYPSHAFMGATPDSCVKCECCGFGVIEVKCPSSCKEKSINTKAAKDSVFFLERI